MRDHNGQALAYIYFEEEPGRRSAAKLLSDDDARRIAANIGCYGSHEQQVAGAFAKSLVTPPTA